MNLSVVIPWDPRTKDEHRLMSLSVIETNIQLIPGIEIKLGEDTSQPFNRSKARNNGVMQSSGDNILILDADTFIPVCSMLEAEEILKFSNWVIPYNIYYNLNQTKTHEAYEDLSVLSTEPVDGEYDHRILSWAGALMVSRENFDKVGGYDERFEGWGWEDVAFRVKLDNEVGHHSRCGSYVSHLWHPRPPEIEFGNEFEKRNAKLFDKEYRRKYNWRDERTQKLFV